MPLSSTDLTRYGKAIRYGVATVYVVGCIAGFVALRMKQIDPRQLHYVATRDLPAGHRLRDGDFKFDPAVAAGEQNRLPAWSVPVGQYVVDHHATEQLIARSELSTAPVINVGKDQKGQPLVPYWVSLEKQPALANALDAGSHVDICAGSCGVQNVKVLSVACNSGATTPDCYVALELAANTVEKIADEAAKNARLILRGN
jgi:hypothetical protein